MRHNRLLQSSNVCWSCLAQQRRRLIHTAGRSSQPQLHSALAPSNGPPPPFAPPTPVRQRLQDWQVANGNPISDLLAQDHASALNTTTAWKQLLAQEGGNPDEGLAENVHGYGLSYARGEFHEPGDLIELDSAVAGDLPPWCIVVRRIGDQLQVITSRGSWMNISPWKAVSSHAAFLDPKLIDPVMPFIPSQEVEQAVLEQASVIDIAAPRSVTGPLVSALAELKHQADEVYRHNAAVLESAHDILAHPSDLRFGGLQNIADKLLGTGLDPTLAQLCAVRKALDYAGVGFYRDPMSHKTTGLYQIRSKAQVHEISLARDWLREYQEVQTTSVAGPVNKWQPSQEQKGAQVVRGFIDKCTERIKASRKTRSPTDTGAIGPSSEKFPVTAEKGAFYTSYVGPPFTEDEGVLLKFIEYWCVQHVFQGKKSLQALAPIILRDTGMYREFELRGPTANVFLHEIGVYDPWVNHRLFDVNLLLPTSQHSKPLERLASELRKMTSRDVDMKDSMRDLRHDWKDLQAFAIDAAQSNEIDDAVSVQRIEGSSSEFWAHVHIANPTAFLERNDIFSKMAMHLTETLYMPEMVYPLLPAWMTQEKFSLESNRPCLTFSAKINLDGEISETKIQPGTLRNVLALEYDQLPEILGLSSNATQNEWSLVVGGEAPARQIFPKQKVSPAQIDDLKLLYKIAQGFAANRARSGAVFFGAGTSSDANQECSVYWKDNLALPIAYPRRKSGIITHGDPIIELRGKRFENPFGTMKGDSMTGLVQELMVMAGHVAASWCDDRNIPILYRGMGSKTQDFIDANRLLIQPAIAEHGFVPIKTGLDYLHMLGRSLLSPEPLYHRALGIKQYAKVSSPLRRFGDMMAHWQIEAAIREESRPGVKSLIGASASDQASYLPYTKAHIDKMITRVEPRERLLKRTMEKAKDHWQCLAFQRAIDHGEAPLPRRAAAVIMLSPTTGNATSLITKARLVDSSLPISIASDGSLEATKLMPEMWPGDVWECEYVYASAYALNITYKPVRLIRREMDPE